MTRKEVELLINQLLSRAIRPGGDVLRSLPIPSKVDPAPIAALLADPGTDLGYAKGNHSHILGTGVVRSKDLDITTSSVDLTVTGNVTLDATWKDLCDNALTAGNGFGAGLSKLIVLTATVEVGVLAGGIFEARLDVDGTPRTDKIRLDPAGAAARQTLSKTWVWLATGTASQSLKLQGTDTTGAASTVYAANTKSSLILL